MSDHKVNSCEYWNERFLTNWEVYNGRGQTRHFAEMAISLMPEWLKDEILTREYSLCDAGCALGDALPVFAEVFPKSKLSGFDVAESAVQKAHELYPDFSFYQMDLTDIPAEKNSAADVVFCSNTLEHFEAPLPLFDSLAGIARKYIIVMVPFRDGSEEKEHETIFSLKNIPAMIGDAVLVFADSVADTSEAYHGRQAFLVYAKIPVDAKRPFLEDLTRNLSLKIYGIEKMDDLDSMETRLEKYREDYEGTRILKDQAERVAKEMDASLSQYKDDLAERDASLFQYKRELDEARVQHQAYIEDSEIRFGKLEREKDEWIRKHDNLYLYSGNLGSELYALKNSRSYKLARILSKCVRGAYRLLRRIYWKTRNVFSALFKGDFKRLWAELTSFFRKVYRKHHMTKEMKRQTQLLCEEIPGKRVVIFPPTLDWHMPLYQRPQQLANAYSKKENTLVIYLTQNREYDDENNVTLLSENLWLMEAGKLNGFTDVLNEAKEIILSISWTLNKTYLKKFESARLIYEYIDELEIFSLYGPEMEEDHLKLVERADVVVSTAQRLYEQVKDLSDKAILSTNGGDYEFFVRTDSYEIDPLIRDRIQGYDCVVGYYGALASWFDYDMIKTVADARPNWAFVLVGFDYDKTLQVSGVLSKKNVIYVPAQPYEKLPGFLKAFDVATVPFLINNITLSTSPVKIFEYMAAKKPIITSAMPECLKYESAAIYYSAEEFIAAVEKYAAMTPEDPYWAVLEKEALENTWDAKTDEILARIQ